MPPSSKANIAWISWERQRRSIELSRRLGARYYELNLRLPRLLRYLICIPKTLFILWKNRDSTIVVQNPSLILALEAAILKRCFQFHLIIDRHTDIYLLGSGQGLIYSILERISNFTIRAADITLVTNQELAIIVRHKKGTPWVLPDPIPDLKKTSKGKFCGEKLSLLLVASWSTDEPICEAYMAAAALPDTSVVFVGPPKAQSPGIFRALCCKHNQVRSSLRV